MGDGTNPTGQWAVRGEFDDAPGRDESNPTPRDSGRRPGPAPARNEPKGPWEICGDLNASVRSIASRPGPRRNEPKGAWVECADLDGPARSPGSATKRTQSRPGDRSGAAMIAGAKRSQRDTGRS